jgi:hypothetical protein
MIRDVLYLACTFLICDRFLTFIYNYLRFYPRQMNESPYRVFEIHRTDFQLICFIRLLDIPVFFQNYDELLLLFGEFVLTHQNTFLFFKKKPLSLSCCHGLLLANLFTSLLACFFILLFVLIS